jgi:MFS family permease
LDTSREEIVAAERAGIPFAPVPAENAVEHTAWYHGVTRYQWLVLLIASLGWIFDVFEGQIFVASMNEAMPALLPPDRQGDVAYYNNVTFACFLLGGALGGVVFGVLSDRIGRKRTMTYTILMYSLFTCVSALSQSWWHFAGLRFLVAMGVGGEWAVASALVAEVFPKRARAWSLGIFHASSVLGTWLAIAAGAFIIGNKELGENAWRWGFVLGAVPAVLIIWIRWSVKEPESWQQAQQQAKTDLTRRMGRVSELFTDPTLLHRTLLGVSLATIGLATFWGTHIYGKDLYKKAVARQFAEDASATAASESRAVDANLKRQEMLGMFLVTTGGGLGLLAFGPLCERLGRRWTFLLFHVGGLASALVLFQGMNDAPPGPLLVALPIFGFLTLGMHAGYAIYFPELFPTRLRGSGAGFCFNVGRLLAAPILFLGGWMQTQEGLDLTLEQTASLLSLLFALGIVLLAFAPETKGQELPQ